MIEDASAPRSTYLLARWLFVRSVGLCFLLAILSLWPQIHGLMGARGIEPVRELLTAVHQRLGSSAYWRVPTLFWLSDGDGALDLVCGAGVLLSLAVVFGYAQGIALGLLFVIYLSISSAGGDFLQFQWDALLLETGFMTIFLAPLALRSGAARPASSACLWLPRFLTFRLMIGSGVSKLKSGDPTWRDLTALSYHYQTQPLPTPLGWYVHHLPLWVHRATTLGTFVVELVVPFLIFAPWRRGRIAAALTMMGLQVGIASTGNYCYFNLLSAALCLPILDDAFLRRLLPRRLADRPALPAHPRRRVVCQAVAIALLAVATPIFVLGLGVDAFGFLHPVLRMARAFGVVSHYGLFSVMTTSRPEIVIEGSNDGVTFLPYSFPYKAGDVMRRPRFVAPYHPRLDWQMWFAALGSVQSDRWFVRLVQRILQGSPEVLALLRDNPFPEKPPRFVRAILYDYQFTSLDQKRATGAWWKRQELGVYCPALSLPDFEVGSR